MNDELERKKARLARYTQLQRAIDGIMEELARRENRQYIPATPESDGSKRNPGASDRMANAVINRITFEAKAQEKMQKYDAEMSLIEDAVLDLEDGLEQQVILLRYITGTNDGTQLMPWREIAIRVYGSDEDANMQAVFRVHKRALKNIGGLYADTN